MAGASSGLRRARVALLRAFVGLGASGELCLPVEADGYSADEIRDAMSVAREVWRIRGAFSEKDLRNLVSFLRPGAARRLDLPGGIIAERVGRAVRIALRRV